MSPSSLENKNMISELFELSKGNKKVVFVSGNFNVVHPGHLRLLRFASECGDCLAVGVNSNETEGTILDEKERLESVKAIGCVDYAFVLRNSPAEFVDQLKPSIVVKGKEHEHISNDELGVIEGYGGKLLFSSGDLTYSSIDLLKKEFSRLNHSSITASLDFLSRHNISVDDLLHALEKMGNLRVCVLGELIVDEYISCDPVGMSQEDPTIVVTPVHKDRFLGGAGIVAGHANRLGAKTDYFSVIGNDELADWVKSEFESYGVDYNLYRDDSRPTILKQRFRANNKSLLRVNHLRNHDISSEIQKKMIVEVKDSLSKCDLLIFSDFNYGCLPQEFVDEVTKACLQNGVMVVADSQSSSQLGDIGRFRNANLVTPTEREARVSLRDHTSGLVVLAENLRKLAQSENVLITLASEGIMIHAPAGIHGAWHTDRLPSFNSSPKDVAGAGDSLMTTSSMALAAGSNIWQSAYLGSLAAACQVGRVGNTPLTVKEIRVELLKIRESIPL